MSIAAIVFLFGSFVAAGNPAAWRTFTSEEGGFSILLPGSFTLTHPAEATPIGRIGENLYTLDTKEADFSVEYSDLPSIAVDFESREGLYFKAKERMIQVLGGHEISFQPVEISGYPGKELSYEAPGSEKKKPVEGRARFLLVDKRIYVISVSGPADKSALIIRYLCSFRLLNKK